MLPTTPTWLITGCSGGLGRALARHVLEQGHRAVVTARDPGSLTELVELHGGRALALALDVNDAEQVSDVAARAEEFGGVDVLVNNAGYGYVGAIEEGEDEEIRALFETNFFAPVHLTRVLLPGMRSRGHGHVVNISSIGGFTTFPAIGYYHATKFALEAISETLAQELEPFGLGVTIVEPGAFRTDFRGRSMRQPTTRLAEYAATAGAARDAVLASDGAQENDPALGAAAIVAAVCSDRPPLRLLLGADALRQARDKVRRLTDEFDAWEQLSVSTRFVDR